MILVGLNGHGGIQIIDPSDWTIRCVEGPGNVWSIAPARVATSPPYGFVAVDGWEAVTYCISGNVIASCDSYTELRHLHCVDLDDDGEDEIVAIGSMFGIGEILSAFRRDGELMWATRLKDSGFHLDSPLFTLTVDLVQMVAVASQHGVTFFSTMGEQLDHFQIAITGAAPLKTKSTSDRLVLRGHGFLSCYEIEPSGSEGL